MKKWMFIIVAIFVTKTSLAQQAPIVRVSSNGNTALYTNLKTAMSEAQDDDFIYIPGGNFTIDSLNFRKRVHVIGTGHYVDSTIVSGKTLITGKVYRLNGSNGASIQGVHITENIRFLSSGDFTISKCNVNAICADETAASGNITVSECVVRNVITIANTLGPVWINSSLSYTVRNSLVFDISYCSNSNFYNCLFFNFGGAANGLFQYSSNNVIQNSIFQIANGTIGSGVNNQVFYCHFANFSSPVSYPFGSTVFANSNLTYEVNLSYGNTTCLGGTIPSTFQYPFNYRIKNTSPAYNSGSDGKERGIYGGATPYNPNPYNPHIFSKTIAPTTNAQGQLQITVGVKAQ